MKTFNVTKHDLNHDNESNTCKVIYDEKNVSLSLSDTQNIILKDIPGRDILDLNLNLDSLDRIKNKRDFRRCSQCLQSTNLKLIRCFVCKSIKCKSCIMKEAQSPHIQKREATSYICSKCLDNQTKKLRPKPSEGAHYYGNSDSQSEDKDSIEDLSRRKRKRTKTTPCREDQLLDLDYIHESFTPPSELIAQRKAVLLARKKFSEYMSCHQCKDKNTELIKCSNTNCDQLFCIQCIDQYREFIYDKCFKCQKICKCSACAFTLNEIRIGKFLIIEEEIQDPSEEAESNKFIETTPRELKFEEKSSMPRMGKQVCLICKITKENAIEFRALEDFVNYTRDFFNCEASGTKTEDEEDIYIKSRKEFKDYYNNYEKFYRNSQFLFKSPRYICKECFISQLRHNRSFYDLFNCLRICRHLTMGKQTQVQGLSSDANINRTEIPRVESSKSRPNNNSFNILKENLNKMEDSTTNNNADLNVTNIIMNIDPLKSGGSNVNVYMSSLVDEIKKQFFSVQYHSLLQKLLISYVFKTVDKYFEKVNENQLICDFLVNSMTNTIQRNSEMTEGQGFMKELLEQVNLLKGVSSRFNILASALNSNMTELKTNGMQIFKSTADPNNSNTNTTENDFNNILDQLKSLINIQDKNPNLGHNLSNLSNLINNTQLSNNTQLGNNDTNKLNENSYDNMINNFNLIKAYTSNLYNNNINNQGHMFNQSPSSAPLNPSMLNSNILANLLNKLNNGNQMGMNINQQMNQMNQMSHNNFIPNFDSNRFNLDNLRTHINNPLMNFQMPPHNSQLNNMNVNNIPHTIGYDNFIKPIENVNLPLINDPTQNLNSLLYNNLNNRVQANILNSNIPYQMSFNNQNPQEGEFTHNNKELNKKDGFNQ